MSGFSLQHAQQQLQHWLDIESKLDQLDSWSVAGSTYKRHDLGEVRRQIDYWQKKAARFNPNRRRVVY